MKTRNPKSAIALIKAEKDEIIFGKNKAGHGWFACGNTEGYVSPKAYAELLKKEDCDLNQLRVVECQKPGDTKWVPVMQITGGNNVAGRVGAQYLD